MAIPVKLPKIVVKQLDELVKEGRFQNRSDALRFAARLLLLYEKKELPISLLAKEYLYEEWKQKQRRVNSVYRC